MKDRNKIVQDLLQKLINDNLWLLDPYVFLTGSLALLKKDLLIRREVQDIDILVLDKMFRASKGEYYDGDNPFCIPESVRLIKEEECNIWSGESDYKVLGRIWVEYEGIEFKIELLTEYNVALTYTERAAIEYASPKRAKEIRTCRLKDIIDAKLSYILGNSKNKQKHIDDLHYLFSNNSNLTYK